MLIQMEIFSLNQSLSIQAPDKWQEFTLKSGSLCAEVFMHKGFHVMMPFLFGQPPSGMLYLFHNVERRKIKLYNEIFYNLS